MRCKNQVPSKGVASEVVSGVVFKFFKRVFKLSWVTLVTNKSKRKLACFIPQNSINKVQQNCQASKNHPLPKFKDLRKKKSPSIEPIFAVVSMEIVPRKPPHHITRNPALNHFSFSTESLFQKGQTWWTTLLLVDPTRLELFLLKR